MTFRSILPFFRRHWLKILIILLVVLPLGAVLAFIFTPTAPEYVTATVIRKDLTQTVEAVGKVISERDLELKFPVSGIVSVVYVKEGDLVEQGTILAELRADNLRADVASASARLQAARADLQALVEGTREEEIFIAEAEVENRRRASQSAESSLNTAIAKLQDAEDKLKILQQESSIALSGLVSKSSSTVSKELSSAQTSTKVLEDFFNDVNIQNYVDIQGPAIVGLLKRALSDAEVSIESALRSGTVSQNYQEALVKMRLAREAVSLTANLTSDVYDFIATLPVTGGNFTYAVRETLKATIATEKSTIGTSLSSLDTSIKELQDASASYDTRIASEQSNLTSAKGEKDRATADLQTALSALRVTEAQLQLKRSGARKTDIDAARARVNQAAADLQKSQAGYNDTILLSPIDAKITKVNLKPGEFTPGQFSQTDAAMTILGTTPYRIEMYASEIDIPKVVFHQTGSISLDAFPEREFALSVSEIDPAATLIDGVPKYRIMLDFNEVEETMKIGMTGDVDIVIERRDEVLTIPGRAIIRNADDEKIVRVLKNGEVTEHVVTTGLETDTDIEILSGVEEGEQIVVLIKAP